MINQQEAEVLLRTALNRPNASFRAGQWEAIDALVNRRQRVLVVQRTGWGKSYVYFLATKLLRELGHGPTLIVSPLLALMRNQVQATVNIDVEVAALHSQNTAEWNQLRDQIHEGRIDALLISPERLANEQFLNEFLEPIAGRIGLLVVDEAHCISDWGHDFRPNYRRIVNVLRALPEGMPVLGTTATANNRVIEDIRNQFGDIHIQRGPLKRESLELEAIHLDSQAERLQWLVDNIDLLPGTGIIYTLTKRDSDRVATWLRSHGIEASAYYSDVVGDGFDDSGVYREHLEQKLLNNELKALVATTALGMGFDKPDLGFVVHFQAPSSVIAYYQQVGRAGREIERAVGILMSGREDEEIHQYFRTSAFPTVYDVESVLDVLGKSDGLSVREIEKSVNLRQSVIQKTLTYLAVENPSPVIKEGTSWHRTAIDYSLDTQKISLLTKMREIEWQEIRSYINEPNCLMEFLSKSMDDPAAEPCGQCASCIGRSVLGITHSVKDSLGAEEFLKESDIEWTPKKQLIPNSLPTYQLASRDLKKFGPENGRILCFWGDAGWGEVVKSGKYQGNLDNSLVIASANLIRLRWIPSPFPQWLACISSDRNPSLVPSFSKRLARELGIPFLKLVQKTGSNHPQKDQQNRFHQCNNLDGVFDIEEDVPSTPGLLVDDTIDSGWTMTIVSVLLRKQGSGPIFPFALASTKPGD